MWPRVTQQGWKSRTCPRSHCQSKAEQNWNPKPMVITSRPSTKKATCAVSCRPLLQLLFLLENLRDFKSACAWADALGVSLSLGEGIQSLCPVREGRSPGGVGPGEKRVWPRAGGRGPGGFPGPGQPVRGRATHGCSWGSAHCRGKTLDSFAPHGVALRHKDSVLLRAHLRYTYN